MPASAFGSLHPGQLESLTPMKLLSASLLSLSLGTAAMAQETKPATPSSPSASALTVAEIQAVSPALARYAQEDIRSLLKCPQLSRRDRGLVTASIRVARGQTTDLAHHLNVALNSGVAPGELSEAITHLAFYAGWPSAMAAVAVAGDFFAARGVDASDLPQASPELRPMDDEA